MKYQTIDGILYDIEAFDKRARQIFDYMYQDAQKAQHWTTIMSRWALPIHNYVCRIHEEYDVKHPLVQIKLDLIARTGVQLGQMSSNKVYPDAIIED